MNADYDHDKHVSFAHMGLPFNELQQLSQEAKFLYESIFDYCTYSSDPQYNKLHKYRNQIDSLKNFNDKQLLIKYFNGDPAINWPGIPEPAFDYYSKPF